MFSLGWRRRSGVTGQDLEKRQGEGTGGWGVRVGVVG